MLMYERTQEVDELIMEFMREVQAAGVQADDPSAATSVARS